MGIRDQAAFDELVQRACKAFDSLTPAQQTHHMHRQKISFAAGNIAIDSEQSIEYWTELVTRAAGVCPCGDCGEK